MVEHQPFSLINKINPSDKSTWENKLFLTFDIDWAADEVIEDTLSLCESFGAKATLFATHKSAVISQLENHQSFEIGIHPNFNQLLWGKSNNSLVNFHKIVEQLKAWFPTASSVRSHSLCFGSLIQSAYDELELTHDSSILVPFQGNAKPLFPWTMWDGLIRVPYLFCDYITSMLDSVVETQNLAQQEGLKVFDFHPIHIFLNTESLDRYELTRSIHQNPKELIKFRHKGYGSRNRLTELLQLAKQQ